MADERSNFLRAAVLLQGGLFLGALAIGWGLGVPLWERCSWSFSSVAVGVIATLPMLLMLAIIYRSRFSGFVRIQKLVSEILGRSLIECRLLDLVVVAFLAGISEEFLFRGVLESYFCRWGLLAGLVISNLLFGLCHALTITYAVLASAIGIYLSLTQRLSTEPNLVIPIVSHSLYDLVAFVVVRNSYRQSRAQDPPNPDRLPPSSDTPDRPLPPDGL
jgi:membrane protease YdiL (CAAX protease family)